MKKKFLAICLFILFLQPAWAEYKPIPKELSIQYKNEVEQAIKTEFNNRYNRIKNYDYIISNKKPELRYTSIDMGLQAEIFDFFMPLIDITDKYTNIKNDIPVTDFWFTLHEILIPYFNDNNIDIHLIDKLIKYSEKKEQILRNKFLTKNDFFRDYSYLNTKICYNFRSLKYNKFKNIYDIDIAIALSDINSSYKYKYPYKNGYITNLIFRLRLQNNKFSAKFKGFVANSISINSRNETLDSSEIIAIEMHKPKILVNLKPFEHFIYDQINKDTYKSIIKNLANN